MSDQELAQAVEEVTVLPNFLLTKKQGLFYNLRLMVMRSAMGDGINDAPSMKVADVGISVDTAVDIAKETADVILLDKDLMVLEKDLLKVVRSMPI